MHRVCIGGAPRGLLLPRKILSFVSPFLSLFETAPNCVSLIGFVDKLNDCLSSCLPGSKPPSIVNCFGPNEFERTLAVPTARIIERHVFRSKLDFLLMKLRTALDKDWLQKLPPPFYIRWFAFLSIISLVVIPLLNSLHFHLVCLKSELLHR